MKSIAFRRWTSGIVRVFTVIAGLVVLVITIGWLSGMFESKVQPGRSDRHVRRLANERTDVVHEIEKSTIEEAIGTLKASSRTVVSSKIMATIDEIAVVAGDQVEQGQVLIRLDDKEYQSRLDQAKRALDAAIANRKQAEKQYQRVETLSQQNAASRSEFDSASRDVQVTLADEARSRQAVSEAEVMLSYTTIDAAKSGRIVDRLAEPGDISQPGVPILVLYDATSLRLEAPVMEHLAVQLKPGDQLKVYVDAHQREYSATVDEIVPQADAPSRSFLVKASLPKSDDLYEGMFGRLLIPAGERRHLCLNTDALIEVGQLEFVDVVLPEGTIERRLVKIGQLGMPGRREVLSGVEAGERVLIRSEETSDAQ
ncbi:efflux RND transporter periplasmic adaptor subunit [Neorhodopirellula pilleata]|uniref:Macrolide export protein MacA n=1 Tax=Neorhodopirellula pilleata TaxID=2714738 RepID=A0A5C5ZT09_9BACT|nr:efflux RND transporter periplasmic adaptor subunit [Neorhodopirellula pilleata]TWT89363.1 Macrolide export protein MacA [Neorhodopirellula pilleata]